MVVFRINATCTSLELVHKTTVDNVPTAICGFQGRVIIGIGRILRLYDIGKKKLLRKCENKVNYTWFFFSLSESILITIVLILANTIIDSRYSCYGL